MSDDRFAPDVVAAICRHINDDHRADSLLICQTLAGVQGAIAAEAVGVDPDGMRFQVRCGDGTSRSASVAFSTAVVERAAVRAAVVELYERACAAAGVTPRDH